jgi:hypothetical protein
VVISVLAQVDLVEEEVGVSMWRLTQSGRKSNKSLHEVSSVEIELLLYIGRGRLS